MIRDRRSVSLRAQRLKLSVRVALAQPQRLRCATSPR